MTQRRFPKKQHEAAVADLRAQITDLESKFTSEKNDNLRHQERIAQLQHALWGRRSEKQPLSPDAPFQSALFEEESVAPGVEEDAPEETEQQETTTRKKPRRKPRFREDVERKVIDIELPESERQCSCCGETMASIGFESAERAHHVPARIVIHEERRHKYACKCKEGGVTTTPVPPTLFPKSRVTDETRVHAIVSKFVDHCPYYRQSAILRRLGFEVSDATLGRLAIEAADRLAPIIIAMHEELLASSVLQADETTLPVLKTEKQKPGAHRGWLWAYGIPRGTIVFDYTRTRAKNHPLGFLEGYAGILQVDRYEGYNPVLRREDVIDMACWAHARRRFLEAERTNGRKAKPIIELIGNLFAIEKRARESGIPPDERSQPRQSQSISILDELNEKLRELAGEV